MRCSAAKGKVLVIEYAQFRWCSPGFFRGKFKMAANRRNTIPPAWIVLPMAFACGLAAVATWGTGSLLTGLATAAVGALSAAWWCERALHAVVRRNVQIAGGDRYAALPSWIG